MVNDDCTVDIHISPFCCTFVQTLHLFIIFYSILYVIPLLILLLYQRARVLYHVLA